MKHKWLIIAIAAFLVLLSPIFFRKHTVPLVSNGKVIAVAKRSFAPHWNESAVDVYVGKEKAFSLWSDFFDFPLFIYPFPDKQRFLCIDDDDTSVLVFVVDLSASGSNAPNSFKWPTDDYIRAYMASRASNVVIETKGFVRLPNYSELQEVSSNLVNLTSGQFKATSFPCGDLGIYRFYWTKGKLLSELAADRKSVWP
jgi:hypothetical protein